MMNSTTTHPVTRSELGRCSGQKFPIRALLLPVHQDVKIGGAFLAIGDGVLFTYPMETDDRCGADHTNSGVLVFQRQKVRVSVGGVGGKGRLVLDPAIGVAVAEFRRAERVEYLGVGGELRRAECLDALGDGIFIRRSREGRDHAQESNGKRRQEQHATIDIHCFLRSFCMSAVLQSRPVLSSTVANNLEAWVLRREEIDSILGTDGNLPTFRSMIPAI